MFRNTLYRYPDSLGYNLHCYLIYNIREEDIKALEIYISDSDSKVRIQEVNRTKENIVRFGFPPQIADGLEESSPEAYYYIIRQIFEYGVYPIFSI